MYNVFKVARGHALVYFNEVFDALSKVDGRLVAHCARLTV